MDINIVGYSERGVINALFYSIALNKDEKAMKEFLSLAGIKSNYNEYKLFSEFSLSEFGSPDLVIIADKKDVFFIEAKVSCGKKFDLKEQKKRHDDYINSTLKNKKFEDGHASNIFFQLRLKDYFFKHIILGNSIDELNLPSDILESRGRNRKKGNNIVVNKFIEELKNKKAYYIAIIPECENYEEPLVEKYDDYNMSIRFVTWESIINGKYTGSLLTDTIFYNQDAKVSQILNKPFAL